MLLIERHLPSLCAQFSILSLNESYWTLKFIRNIKCYCARLNITQFTLIWIVRFTQVLSISVYGYREWRTSMKYLRTIETNFSFRIVQLTSLLIIINYTLKPEYVRSWTGCVNVTILVIQSLSGCSSNHLHKRAKVRARCISRLVSSSSLVLTFIVSCSILTDRE